MKVLAVMACPSGVAHTYMAAQALEDAAEELGHEIKIETQGSIGVENEITAEDVKEADVAILSKDLEIQKKERFNDIPVVKLVLGEIINKPKKILNSIEVKLKGNS